MELDPTETVQNKQDSKHREILDRDEYERQAREKAKKQREEEEDAERKAKGLAPLDRSRPKPSKADEEAKQNIQARERKLNLEGKIGKTEVTQGLGSNKQPGYYCQHCDVTLKDSASWLDHINSKRHLTNTGYSTRQTHSTLEQVIARLEYHRRKRAAPKIEYDLDARVLKAQKENEEAKEAKKKRKQQKKEQQEAEMKEHYGEPDDEMSKMMGFGAFGSSKK